MAHISDFFKIVGFNKILFEVHTISGLKSKPFQLRASERCQMTSFPSQRFPRINISQIDFAFLENIIFVP